MKRAAIVIVLALAIGAAAWWLTRPTAIDVAIVAVTRGSVTASITNTRAGTVDACRRAGIAPAMGGQIEAMYVKDGDIVEEGAVLLELWNDDLQAQLTLAERDVRASRSQQRQACITADVANREADRLMSLRDQGLASEESAEKALGLAQSSAAACEASRDLTEVSAARVDLATAQLERTRLRAPFAGVVAEVNGELGEFVTPSPVGIPTPPTVDLIDTTCLYISAPIDEVDAPRAKAGLRARISLDAYPGRVFDGRVRRVAPYVLDMERQARTVEVEAEILDAAQSGLLPGYSADVEIILDSRDDAVRIPSSVVLPDSSVFVFHADTGRIEKRSVQTGISNWEFTEILSGLTVGETLVSTIDRAGIADGAIARSE
jgi:HlyD family secretion protein